MEYVIFNSKKYEIKSGELNLNEKRISKISDVKRFSKTTSLIELFLRNNKISEIDGLDSLKYLEFLWLTNNKISEIKGLESLTNLIRLNLNYNKIRNIKGLRTLTNLKYLSLDHNIISTIEDLERLSNLTYLDLSSNQITEIKGLKELTNIQHLVLSYNNLTKIDGLDNLHNLRHLNLSHNKILTIEGLENLLKLEHLDIRNNLIDKVGGLKNLKNLEYLALKGNPINIREQYLLHRPTQDLVSYCSMKKKVIYQYDFALSFAGEDREIVDNIAESLSNKGIKVFYDKFYKTDLVGRDLFNHFKSIYGKKSKFVVMFISKNYVLKDWTNFEFEIAKDEAKTRKKEFIIPIRLDSTIIHGLSRNIGYIDFEGERYKGTLEILTQKLNKFNLKYGIV